MSHTNRLRAGLVELGSTGIYFVTGPISNDDLASLGQADGGNENPGFDQETGENDGRLPVEGVKEVKMREAWRCSIVLGNCC